MLDRTYLTKVASQTPVVILAGGLGTRLSEETTLIPKPMVEVGGLPIIVHIMDYYAKFGFQRFVICGGYRIEVLKNYFMTLPLVGKDVEIRFSRQTHSVSTAKSSAAAGHRDKWEVTILETGLHTMTGGRVCRALDFLGANKHENICLTYGDGLCNVDLHKELAFHLVHGKHATVLGVHPPTRFGILEIGEHSQVTRFAEKPSLGNEYINGGYFILRPDFARHLRRENLDACVLEKEPLESAVAAGQLCVFKHEGFWQCMDTKREKAMLEEMLAQKNAPWLAASEVIAA